MLVKYLRPPGSGPRNRMGIPSAAVMMSTELPVEARLAAGSETILGTKVVPVRTNEAQQYDGSKDRV